MKLFRVAFILTKRRQRCPIYKAIVLAETKEEAIRKVEEDLGKPLKDLGDGFIEAHETSTDVYTF